ncbi:MAG: hypothetical protein WA840_14680 [Caulobacteraceae bacterium]
MAARIIASILIAASLLAAPAFAQTPPAPSSSKTTTTMTDTKTADTDASGKTTTKHHKVVKHIKKATAPKADDAGAAGNTTGQ